VVKKVLVACEEALDASIKTRRTANSKGSLFIACLDSSLSKIAERDGDYERPQPPISGRTHVSSGKLKVSKGKSGFEQVDLFGT
jgi:hypothetical protein